MHVDMVGSSLSEPDTHVSIASCLVAPLFPSSLPKQLAHPTKLS